MPTSETENTLVLDVGANVDCSANNLFEFAIMGQAYAEDVLKIDSPLVGLLSNGEEESKGNEITKEAFKLISKLPNFTGNIEGNNIFDGSVDVVVCGADAEFGFQQTGRHELEARGNDQLLHLHHLLATVHDQHDRPV